MKEFGESLDLEQRSGETVADARHENVAREAGGVVQRRHVNSKA